MAVYLGQTISRSSTSREYPVEFVYTVREKNTLEAFENFLRVNGTFDFKEIADGVGIITITEHGPDDIAADSTTTFLQPAFLWQQPDVLAAGEEPIHFRRTDGIIEAAKRRCVEPATSMIMESALTWKTVIGQRNNDGRNSGRYICFPVHGSVPRAECASQ